MTNEQSKIAADTGWTLLTLLGTAGGWLLGGADNSPASGEGYQGIFGSLMS